MRFKIHDMAKVCNIEKNHARERMEEIKNAVREGFVNSEDGKMRQDSLGTESRIYGWSYQVQA